MILSKVQDVYPLIWCSQKYKLKYRFFFFWKYYLLFIPSGSKQLVNCSMSRLCACLLDYDQKITKTTKKDNKDNGLWLREVDIVNISRDLEKEF